MASKEIITEKDWKTVCLKKLNVRYIPIVTPRDIWKDSMLLIRSPHVHLMYIFYLYGFDWERIKKSDYYLERKHRYSIGMKRWSDSKIKSHIKARYSIFKSIKKHGYDPKFDNSNPIQVLKQPFWKTRFGLDEPWLNGLEIWNGAGRCAAAYALGIDRLKVKMCTDRYPGTNDKGKFKDKLKSVKGVWSD